MVASPFGERARIVLVMPEETPPPPRDRAVLSLFRASALLDGVRLHIWDQENLTVTQLRLLSFLEEEGGLSNAELAERLYVTRPSVSALLERLDRAGFIRREVSQDDRRGIRIWLEERGQNAVAQLREDTRAYAANLMSDLTDNDLTKLADALEHFVLLGRARRTTDLQADRGEMFPAG